MSRAAGVCLEMLNIHVPRAYMMAEYELAAGKPLTRGKSSMATFTVKQGKRYRATITLGWLERLAGNETIAEKLRAAGFSEVSVSGSGRTRTAEAVWTGPDASGDMPAQVTEVIEI